MHIVYIYEDLTMFCSVNLILAFHNLIMPRDDLTLSTLQVLSIHKTFDSPQQRVSLRKVKSLLIREKNYNKVYIWFMFRKKSLSSKILKISYGQFFYFFCVFSLIRAKQANKKVDKNKSNLSFTSFIISKFYPPSSVEKQHAYI